MSELLTPGELLADRYRVCELLGRGAMGVVYAGEHVRVGRPVAIKVLTREWSREPSIRHRFEAEARAASAAGHPNVVQVLDVGELPDGRLYTVMELVGGIELHAILRRDGPLAIDRACRLVRDIAHGVRAAHARGVIHRDLKPENVMVQALPEGEVVKVLDFGIAAGIALPVGTTAAGVALGTPEYMAPEQVDGRAPTVAFDIYALGVMLFELLTGRLPITGEHPLQLMALKGHVPAPRVRTLRPEIAADLDQLVADCLAIDPSVRPASCEALIGRLDASLAGLVATPQAGANPGPPVGPLPARPTRMTRPYHERGGGSAAGIRVAGTRETQAWPLVLGLVVAVGLVVGALAWLRPWVRADGDLAAEAALAREGGSPAEPRVSSPDLARDVAGAPEPAAAAVADDGLDAGPELAAGPEPGAEATVEIAPPAADDAAPKGPAERSEPKPSETPRCAQVRDAALEARRIHDWDGVLRAAKSRDCWASARTRKKLEAQAYMELGRFSDCLRVGEDLNDTEVRTWVTLCKKRLGG